jgi:hypothetical protein
MILQNKGEIYMITSPCGKKYIGQTLCLVKRKSKMIEWGSTMRWKEHVKESKSKTREGCVKLNNFINKYKAENFIVQVLLICDIRYLNYFETYMINEYNTLSPNGLNLKKGGDKVVFSEETKKKMSDSAKGRTFSKETIEKIRIGNQGKIVSNETRQKLSQSLMGKSISEEHKQKISDFQKNYLQPKRKYIDLPDYIYRINYPNKQGYMVRNHPTLKTKCFVSIKLTMEEKFKLAQLYLEKDNGSTTK